MIYLDNAASSAIKPDSVKKALCQAVMRDDLGNAGRGAHESSLRALQELEAARSAVAEFFGAEDSQVAFTANATMSLNLLLKSLLKAGDHVISTCSEHNSVLRPLYQLEEEGVALSFAALKDYSFQVDVDSFQQLLRPNTRAVVVNHASNVTGEVIDLAACARFCRAHDLLLILDAAQSAGEFSIDMEADAIDALCFTGHKSLYGPGGTGGIVLGSRMADVPLKAVFSGGSGVRSFDKTHPAEMPALFESGTANVLGLIGLHAGVKYLQKMDLSEVEARLKKLTRRFYEGVKDLPAIKIYGDFSDPKRRRAPIVALNVADMPAGVISDILATDFDIATRPGAHCAPLMHQALGTSDQGIVRFSFSTMNSEADIDKAVAAVREISQSLI
ncbi:MAG: aminotransferase class V-fold PLP-dependent enzyme [Eubacteriales bacterium]|nr:aminotransferase class V-fold PLP-dependent enzyme [Eubacteriales bacterium]MDD4324525.1 aminotransferase class V-fold PLP-dependent enzyme [Eubacteriales bacterium]MDD4542008.1 aminotransferase class V-fold PLP-dependent enzyme [Eubacteriales bacterium]